MAGRNRKLLQIHHKAIVQDLEVMDIIDELLAKQAISSEDFEYIANVDKADRIFRTRYLLNLISQSSNSAYDTFVDSLEENHDWLWKLLAIDTEMGTFEDSLSRGDVPRLPDHFVRRTLLEKHLSSKVRRLARHNILVLHGMSGCGKTTLAISVLRNNSELITTDYNGVVYWLNMGNCKTVDDVIAQQNKLYRKASLATSHMNSSISMSSIGSNTDSLSNYDLTWQDLKDKLKSLFAEQPLKDGLLVLDEVNEKICMEGFDIGCKILVTTRDNNVVSSFQPHIVKIENYFSEEESLVLFGSCLEVAVKDLPRQAKKLHEICKGSPFHIALIGAELAENKERLVHDTRRWNYYISKLEKKEFIFNFTRSDVNPIKTVEFCINSLNPDLLKLFKMLAILPDNVKLSTNVFAKLWNKSIIEIDIIIQQLRSKSLIMVFYDEDKHDYAYEIHDLIMDYLRTTFNEEDIKKLHTTILTSYSYSLSRYPIEIEDDGYIALYIGYHLFNTKNLNKMWSLFNRLYLNLKFLGNKVRLTGPADVIADLQKYENFIVNDDLDKALLYNIKEYLSTHGIDLYRYPYTDIIQSILQNESKGILYTKAWEVARDRSVQNELYFEFIHEQNVEPIRHSTIDVKESIKSVCFLGDYVLIGTKTGVIKLFHIGTNKLKKEVLSTDTSIEWVGSCPARLPCVAALDGRGALHVCHVDDAEQAADGVIEEEPEETHNNNFPSQVTISLSNVPFLNCRWSNHDETLITHTSHVIYVYNTNGDIKYCLSELYKDVHITCCVPSNYENCILVATSNSFDIVDLKAAEKQSFEESGHILDIVIVPGTNKVITLKEKQVTQHIYKMLRRFNKNSSDCETRQIISSDVVKENIRFLSIAVNKSGSLLFVSTNDSRVICVDLKTYAYVMDLENRRGNVVSMSVSEVAWDELEAGPDVLLTGTDDAENSAKVWYLDTYAALSRLRNNGKVRLTTIFDVSFMNALTPPTPSTLTNNPQSTPATPKRHQSFANTKVTMKENKNIIRATMSLDRHSLKPLNLKGITNGVSDGAPLPLLAVVDDRNNIQVMRGRKLITEIQSNMDEQITAVKISPCNHYIIYGLKSGIVRRFSIRTKECEDIMNVNSSVEYMNFVNSEVLVVAGKNRCLMAYKMMAYGLWEPQMLERGNANLGSQEILNDIQGIKKKSQSQSEIDTNSSGSDSSISSKDRLFPSCDKKGLCKASTLVDSYWIPDLGIITIESNATIKLWDGNLNLRNILNGRQTEVCITCTAFEKNTLIICDQFNKFFQSFELKVESQRVFLELIQEFRLNYRTCSCALTDDGNILAMGLETGDVVLWNVPSKKQFKLLRHHKSKVQWCVFSPTPARLYRSAQSPALAAHYEDAEQPPLVLVSMASEIVWWNVTHIIRTMRRGLRTGQNVITPLASPIDGRNSMHQVNDSVDDLTSNCFFGSNPFDPKQCFKVNWKRKTYKEGSKRKEILGCIKLSGMNAKRIMADEKFSCFITVDNPGHIHIMKLMGSCAK